MRQQMLLPHLYLALYSFLFSLIVKFLQAIFHLFQLVFQKLRLISQYFSFVRYRSISASVCRITAPSPSPSRHTCLIEHSSKTAASSEAKSAAYCRIHIARCSKACTKTCSPACHRTHSHRTGSITSWHNCHLLQG